MSFNDGFNIRSIPYPSNTAVSGNSLVYNGDSWIAAQVSGSGGGGGTGDITAVNAGTNLTGGGTTGDVTLSLSSSVTGLTNLETTNLTGTHISGSDLKIDYIDFNNLLTKPSFLTGRLYYNADNADLAYDTNVSGVYLNYGQQMAVKVKNATGASIAKGKLVSISGGVGNNPTIVTASWDSEKLSADTIGMMMNTANVNEFAYVLINGVIEDVNTSGYTGGTTLYLSSSGNYTSTVPVPPKQAVRIGHVVREQTNNGSIFINVQNGYELEELHDVLITSSANGDLLAYDSSVNLWKNTKTLSGSYVITGSLTGSISGSLARFGTITGSSVTGSTAQFTTLTANNVSALNLVSSTDGTIVADRVLIGSGSNIAKATAEMTFYDTGTGYKSLRIADPTDASFILIDHTAIDNNGNLDIGVSSTTSIYLGNPSAAVTINGSSVAIDYIPSTPSNWSGSAPTTISEALDRIAAAVYALGGNTPIP